MQLLLVYVSDCINKPEPTQAGAEQIGGIRKLNWK